jgi:glycosyltransferase involved in cell wall biosynthesis
VRLTVESLLAAGADEIVIIDDGSTDGSCNGLDSKIVKVIRNATARGVNKARNQGAGMATGDVLIFCDAHIRVDPQTFRSFAAEAHRRNAFVCAACGPLPPWDRDFTFYGATLVVDGDKKEHLQPKHNNSRPAERFTPITCSLGACYAVARKAYEKMGGWVDTFAWGYSEQGLGLKCFLCDVPLLADRDCRVLHKFKKQFNYPVSRDQLIHVALHTYKVIFEEKTYRDVWVPRMVDRWGKAARRTVEQIDADSEIRKEAEQFKPLRVRSEAVLMDRLFESEPVTS